MTTTLHSTSTETSCVSFSPDLETKSSYTVRIRTTDQDESSYEEAFAITITNVNETPTDVSLSANTVNENVTINTVVGTLSTTDPDAANTFAYTLVTGGGDEDNNSFTISGNSLRITDSPDFETKSSYSVRIRTIDQDALFYEEIFTITINNINEDPADIVLSASSINENVAANTVLGTLSTIDPDATNTFTYSLVAGAGDADNTSFNINGNDLRILGSPDFEGQSSYTVRIRTTDQDGIFYEEAFTITITNVNETPTDLSLTASEVNENAPPNTVVGVLSTSDPDEGNTFTYSLVAGAGDAGNASFNITGNDLRLSVSPDFTTSSNYTVRVRSTDQDGLFYEEIFTIDITDTNEAPTDISLSTNEVDENVEPNTTVGVLSTADPDVGDTFTYSLVAGAGDDDNTAFNISGSELKISESPDFETAATYTVLIRTTDQGGLSYDEAVVIVINDLMENIEINNYMSPNGDGKNDRWEIRGHLNFSECDVKILNRFGNVVYKSKGYDNTWNGTYNGQQLPADVYYYVISCAGNEPVTGDITLIR